MRGSAPQEERSRLNAYECTVCGTPSDAHRRVFIVTTAQQVPGTFLVRALNSGLCDEPSTSILGSQPMPFVTISASPVGGRPQWVRAVVAVVTLVGGLSPVAGSDCIALASRFEVPLGWSDANDRYSVIGTTKLHPKHAWADVRSSLANPTTWCRMTTLVPDVRECAVDAVEEVDYGVHATLTLSVGSGDGGTRQDIEHEFRASVGSDALEASLRAPSAALGVRDAGVTVTAKPGADGVELELEYGLRSSIRSRLATRAYLAGEAGSRPGISYTKDPDGTHQYVTGVRALIERNAMRYFLAFPALLETGSQTDAADAWYEIASHYKADLPERSKEAYIRSRQEFE